MSLSGLHPQRSRESQGQSPKPRLCHLVAARLEIWYVIPLVRPNINCRTRYEQVVFLNSYQLFTVMFMSNGSIHDLLQMATTSQSPSENQPETGGSSTSPGCNTSAGISQILRGKLIQGAVISPSSGIIRTPTSSPSAHLRSSYVS